MSSDGSAGVDFVQAQLRSHAERLSRLADSLTAIRATRVSAEGEVTAVVDGNGTLRELRLSGAISAMTPAEFERIVVDTALSAARAAFAQQAAMIEEFNTV
ncbi:YbaB/EbfC family nucleoid-associated protein [Nocardia sp. NPDC049190]|uniref:YbaB/EbfC family nucleoid-associated protein n=1 Tax=Nocardia sp. NPDC049190 TaxID=3155650 RepID=UPI00340CB1C2